MYQIKNIKLDKVIGISSTILPTNKPEFVMVGRSNVGKSSFINAISNRKNYARTSSTPGKTQTINYYNVDDKFYLVDLPGYGFAKVSLKMQNEFAKFINKYFKTSKTIEEIILLVDIRHRPTDKDKQMYDYIVSNTGYEPIIIATKTDKLKKNEVSKHIEDIKNILNTTSDILIIPFSTINKQGVKEFLEVLERLI